MLIFILGYMMHFWIINLGYDLMIVNIVPLSDYLVPLYVLSFIRWWWIYRISPC